MPTVEFYDFDAKYNDNSTELQIPADLPKGNNRANQRVCRKSV